MLGTLQFWGWDASYEFFPSRMHMFTQESDRLPRPPCLVSDWPRRHEAETWNPVCPCLASRPIIHWADFDLLPIRQPLKNLGSHAISISVGSSVLLTGSDIGLTRGKDD
jgi:hypothetical protein